MSEIDANVSKRIIRDLAAGEGWKRTAAKFGLNVLVVIAIWKKHRGAHALKPSKSFQWSRGGS